MKKTVFSFMILVMAALMLSVTTMQAQTIQPQGQMDNSDRISTSFNFGGTLFKTDTVYTNSFDLVGYQPFFDFTHYVTYTNDSVKINYKLQGYYSYTAKWCDIGSLTTDSLKNIYYVKSDTLKYNPDLYRVMIWGSAISTGGTMANGKQTLYKGTLKFPKKTY